MNKDDFYIIRNSITMMQLANFHRFKITKRGGSYFTTCPFHNDKNASMQIFDGYRGFYCRGCGVGGDITRFTELYENLTSKEAGIALSERFNIPISETGEISEETRQRANKARKDYEQRIALEQQKRAELNQINTMITAYRNIMEEENRMSETYVYCYNKCQYLIYRQELLSLEVYGK